MFKLPTQLPMPVPTTAAPRSNLSEVQETIVQRSAKVATSVAVEHGKNKNVQIKEEDWAVLSGYGPLLALLV